MNTFKKAQARFIAEKLATGEIDEAEAHRLRVKRGLPTATEGQIAQNQQERDVRQISNILADAGAGVRGVHPGDAIPDAEAATYTEKDEVEADQWCHQNLGYSLDEARVLHGAGAHMASSMPRQELDAKLKEMLA